jgi:hypothetical protein
MKPLNLDNRPCSPISSNCVVWQGPTLDCINLCTGDTISDVVAKMAEELCTLLDQTNVTNYDLTCLGITACGPKDFQALIQLLIDKICELENIQPDGTKTENTCPDCPVTVAPCFVQNGQTTMQLIDYVQMIANKVCTLIDEISNIQTEINNLDIRVTALEEATPPSFTLPSIATNCLRDLIPGNPLSATIDIVLNALVNDETSGYCALLDTTGLPSELVSAIEGACITSSTITLTDPPNPFGTVYAGSWVNSPTTVADTITNLWIALCDIYNYAENIGVSVEDTNTIDLNFASGILTANIQDTGWVDLLGFDYYAPGVGRPQCRRMGNQIHFRGVIVIPLTNPASPSTVVSYTGTSYNSVVGCQVFTGGGGCLINTNGSITFNNNNAVIPSTILDPYVSPANPGTNLDNSYGLGSIIAARQIDINATYGTALSAVFNVTITNDKKLIVSVLKDLEITNTRGSAVNLGTMPLRFITSNIRSGEYVPDYITAASDIHNAPSFANFPLTAGTKNATWPFSCDAGEEDQIGGFVFKLDGLIGYVDPCTTDIKTYICK